MLDSQHLQKLLGFSASKLYKAINADQIVVVEQRQITNFIDKDKEEQKLKIIILDKKEEKERYFIMENEENLIFTDKVKSIIMRAIKNGLIKKDSKVVFVFDNSLSDTFPLGMVVLEVSRVLYRIAKFRIAEMMEHEKIIEKIIDIATEIKEEGREGKKVGTMFIIGDEEELKYYLKPLILNPFFGYPENMRDILNNDLSETIKEFAQLDGAFIINNKGIILSAGTYVDIKSDDVIGKSGQGTKHLAATAITQKTSCVAIVVSESGQKIKIFKRGKLILKI